MGGPLTEGLSESLRAALEERRPQEVFRLLPLLTRCIALWSLVAFFFVDLPLFAAGFSWSGGASPDLLWINPGNWGEGATPGPLDSGTFGEVWLAEWQALKVWSHSMHCIHCSYFCPRHLYCSISL